MVINRAIVERDERSRFPISYLFVCSTLVATGLVIFDNSSQRLGYLFVCSTLVATSLATFDIEKKHVLIQNNNEF